MIQIDEHIFQMGWLNHHRKDQSLHAVLQKGSRKFYLYLLSKQIFSELVV